MCFKYTVLHFYCVAYRGLTTKNLVSICHSDLGFALLPALLWLPWWLGWSRICLQCRRPSSIPGSGKYLGEGNDYHFSILAWGFHGQRSQKGNSPRGGKDCGEETDRLID